MSYTAPQKPKASSLVAVGSSRTQNDGVRKKHAVGTKMGHPGSAVRSPTAPIRASLERQRNTHVMGQSNPKGQQ